jgi:hypothetical protein
MHANSISLDTLDRLALALTNHNHCWSDDERQAYESAVMATSGGCKGSGSSA